MKITKDSSISIENKTDNTQVGLSNPLSNSTRIKCYSFKNASCELYTERWMQITLAASRQGNFITN